MHRFLRTLTTLAALTALMLASPGPSASQPPAPPGGSGRVLVIDGSSSLSFQMSIERAAQVLSGERKALLTEHVATMKSALGSEEHVRMSLDGMSVPEVIDMHHMVLEHADTNRDGRVDATERSLMLAGVAEASRAANESAAIAQLRALASAQEQIKATALIDVDRDKVGEYAFVSELTGAVALRAPSGTRPKKLDEALLNAQRHVVRSGRFTRKGYVYQVYLPGPKNRPVAEGQTEGDSLDAPDPRLASESWCCYAWPLEAGKSGRRAFVISQSGVVMACSRHGYSGQTAASADAAMPKGDAEIASLTGRRGFGNDGHLWEPVRE